MKWPPTISSEPSLRDVSHQRAILTEFVINNRELDQLEAHLQQFSIFDAIGLSRQELRHSDFLSFLLKPGEPHGFGDLFLKRLLQRALTLNEDTAAISTLELELMPLAGTELRREWCHIDILISHHQHKLVVAIENKMGSGEHSGQLQRYADLVEREFQEYRQLFIYLTPHRDAASDERYLNLSYDDVVEALTTIVEDRRLGLDEGVLTIITHYVRMLRRHAVTDSEIADLCRRIYAKHKEALDLIYEHRPEIESEMYDFLTGLISSSGQFIRDDSSKNWIRFLPPEWNIPTLRRAAGFTKSNLIAMFQVSNRGDRGMALELLICPGPDEVRNILIETAQHASPPFQHFDVWKNRRGMKWTALFKKELLTPIEYNSGQIDAIKDALEARWQEFLQLDLEALREGMSEPIRALKEFDLIAKN